MRDSEDYAIRYISRRQLRSTSYLHKNTLTRSCRQQPEMKETKRSFEGSGSVCECYVNTAEIKQGRWQEDPSECLRNCKAQFLRNVLQGWGENERWVDGCGNLNRGVVHEFWSLYWCDLTFCGVGIDRAGGPGQDRE